MVEVNLIFLGKLNNPCMENSKLLISLQVISLYSGFFTPKLKFTGGFKLSLIIMKWEMYKGENNYHFLLIGVHIE